MRRNVAKLKTVTRKVVLNFQTGLCEYSHITTWKCGHKTTDVTLKKNIPKIPENVCPKCRLKELLGDDYGIHIEVLEKRLEAI